MKKFYLLILLTAFQSVHAQTIFWTEDFTTNVCGQGTLADGYTTPNGAWSVVSTGINDPESNNFYISASENGNGTGNCGSACGINRTLHVGANDGFTTTDGGASYDAGGVCISFSICVASNWRAESPVINCTNDLGITLSFNYMEFGDGSNDDATLWYYDGSTWSQIDTLAKTTCCGGPCNGSRQGHWTYFSIQLPSSASHNPNVRIGFNWTNNDDGVGNDPSFAIDDIQLSALETTVSEINSTSVHIYPNPVEDFINIDCSNVKDEIHFAIIELTGRKVKESKSIIHQQEKINVADLSSGWYCLQLLDQENKVVSASPFTKQ
jgi:hypothetical protein